MSRAFEVVVRPFKKPFERVTLRDLRAENHLLREALARHERWCGYNGDAPGDGIINVPVVASALDDDRGTGA